MQNARRDISRQELIEDIAAELRRANYYPSGDILNPERALLAAVLHRAILDLIKPRQDTNGKSIREQLLLWFKSQERTPFTFLWICEGLDLNVEPIMKVLLPSLR